MRKPKITWLSMGELAAIAELEDSARKLLAAETPEDKIVAAKMLYADSSWFMKCYKEVQR